MGYPNEDFDNICRLSSYNPDNFLPEMIENIGINKTIEFIGKTFDNLETHPKGSYVRGIKIPLWDPEEFVYLIIEDFNVDPDESEDCVYIDWIWGTNKLLKDDMGGYTTLKELEDDNDPWDLDDFYDQLKEKVSDHIRSLTGFNICWGI